jgi:hypothetical protein
MWFGLARGSVLLLSALLLIFSALSMLGKVGSRYGFWCGLVVLKEWAEGRRKDWEEGSGGLGRVKEGMRVGLGKARRKKGKILYQNISLEDAREDDGDQEEAEEVEVELEMKGEEEKEREEEEIARFELGDLEGEENEEDLQMMEDEREQKEKIDKNSAGGREVKQVDEVSRLRESRSPIVSPSTAVMSGPDEEVVAETRKGG